MNVRPGDMAVVLRSPFLPTAVGTIVEVVRVAIGVEPPPLLSPLYLVRIANGTKCFSGCHGEGKISYAMPGAEIIVPGPWLRKIEPPQTPTDIIRELTESIK